jgi:NAD(P)-dependent dehydrogenase (short-subunit alcohol dehydrogenase family)
MRAGGRIVFVGSLAGEVGGAGQTGYAAAKAGLLGLARSLALEVARGGITVNVVVPGAIDTARLRAAVGDERRAALARGSPLRRLGQPEEVAAAVLWLASRQAAFVTGAAIPVTGGFELGV